MNTDREPTNSMELKDAFLSFFGLSAFPEENRKILDAIPADGYCRKEQIIQLILHGTVADWSKIQDAQTFLSRDASFLNSFLMEVHRFLTDPSYIIRVGAIPDEQDIILTALLENLAPLKPKTQTFITTRTKAAGVNLTLVNESKISRKTRAH